MKQQFKEVAHLYLGCRVECSDGDNNTIFGKLQSIDLDGDCAVMEDDGNMVDLVSVSDLRPILRPWCDMTTGEATKLAWMCMDSEHHLEPGQPIPEDEIEYPSDIEIVFNDGGTMLDNDCEVWIGVTCRCFDGAVIIRKDGSICVEDDNGIKEPPIDDIAVKVAYLLSCGFDMFHLIKNGYATPSVEID